MATEKTAGQRARRKIKESTTPTTRGAAVSDRCHLNRDLARTLRAEAQIAILNRTFRFYLIERYSFKFGNWFRRKATGTAPKLNGCRHSLPPHA